MKQKKCFKTSYSCSADQSTFCVYWFLIKLHNIIINQIHFNTFGGGVFTGFDVVADYRENNYGPIAGGVIVSGTFYVLYRSINFTDLWLCGKFFFKNSS